MNNNIGAFTVGDARHIHKEIFGTRMSQPPMDNTRDKTIHNLLYYALLLEDLTAATDPLTGYTQAQIRVIRYVQPGDGVTLNMEESTTTTGIVQVTNRLTSFSASAGDLLLVIRNGSEWSPVNTGNRVTKIRFKIASSDPTTFTALVDILSWDAGFGINEVPYQIGTPELPIRVVEVCDPAGCFLNEPAEDLFDRAGWAMLMDGSPGGFCRDGYGPFPPVWEVIQLCCRPYSCNVDQ
jgi:hypothetical protein